MFKFLLRILSVCGFFVLGLGLAQAQVPTLALYGIKLNAPLSVPKCEVNNVAKGKRHFPKSVCYVMGEKKKSGLSDSQTAKLYFPKDKVPVGALSNDVDISLDSKNNVMLFAYYTDGLSSQADFLKRVVDQIGRPFHIGAQKSSDRDVGALWKFDDVMIMFMSNEKGMVMVMVMDSPS